MYQVLTKTCLQLHKICLAQLNMFMFMFMFLDTTSFTMIRKATRYVTVADKYNVLYINGHNHPYFQLSKIFILFPGKNF